MKNIIKKTAVLIALVLLQVKEFKAQLKNDNRNILVINGVINSPLNQLKMDNSNCKVYLYHENVIIDSLMVKFDAEFEFKLQRNVWYSIQIVKEGYYPVLISVNTEVPENSKYKKSVFWFETDLIDTKTASVIDKDWIDFPVGIVSYSKNQGTFNAHDKYTKNHMKKLYDIYGNSSEVATRLRK